MTAEDFDRNLNEFLDRQPFQAFIVELIDGSEIAIERPSAVATRSGSALYATTRHYVRLACADVKRFIDSPTNRSTKGEV